jgi:hypothetical protein
VERDGERLGQAGVLNRNARRQSIQT